MTPAQRQSISGLILAGGRSSRMSVGAERRDKALLQFKGKRLIDHVFERLRITYNQLLLVGIFYRSALSV